MVKKIARAIWNISETFGIPLGPFAPHIFGAMIGVEGKKLKNKVG